MKKALMALLLIVLVCVVSFTFVACKKEVPSGDAETTAVKLVMDKYYFGVGDVDLTKAFPEKTVTVSGTNAAVNGNTLTLSAVGDFTLTFDSKDYQATVLEGAKNVATFAEFTAAQKAGEVVCVQSDITDIKAEDVQLTDYDANNYDVGLKADLYGNGHYICAYEIAKQHVSMLDVRANDVTIRDLHISGYHAEAGEKLPLDTFEDIGGENKGCGALVNITGPYSATVDHCIIENGHKVVFVREGTLNLKNSLVRNASDTLVSIETSSCDGATVNLENNILASAVVAGVCMWGWTNVSNDDGYITLNIKGFLDIYNWKEGSTAKLMPGTESLANAVNPLVAKEFDKEQYQEYFYKAGGNRFIHVGMVKLCTSKLKANKATINGDKEVKFERREFPLPGIAKIACNECQVIGYGNSKSDVDIEPYDLLKDSKNAAKIKIAFAS